MEIRYSKQAVKNISKYDIKTKTRIKNGIEGLLKQPPEGDIKQLKGYNPACYRLRIGKYRIIYSYGDDAALQIERVDSRGDIYK